MLLCSLLLVINLRSIYDSMNPATFVRSYYMFLIVRNQASHRVCMPLRHLAARAALVGIARFALDDLP